MNRTLKKTYSKGVMTALGLLEVRNHVQQIYAQYRSYTSWEIRIAQDDEAYRAFMEWLGETTSRRTALTATTMHWGGGSRTVRFTQRADRIIKTVVDGHPVEIRSNEDSGNHRSSPLDSIASSRVERFIVISARSAAGRAAVQKLITSLVDGTGTDRSTLRIASRWGDWGTRSDIPPRRLDTVCLAPGVKERLVSGLGRFLDAEEDYSRLGIPWHYGILLHGMPGTGKTSTLMALADHFKLDINYAPLTDLDRDGDMIRLFTAVGPRSILLLEDVDTLAVTHERDEGDDGTNKGISLGGLLNTLDGAATPHGLIVAMTTNRRDALDPAVIRPGRIDIDQEIGAVSTPQFAELWNVAYPDFGDLDPRTEVSHNVAPAAIVNVFKAHIGDPAGALRALHSEGLIATRSTTKEHVS